MLFYISGVKACLQIQKILLFVPNVGKNFYLNPKTVHIALIKKLLPYQIIQDLEGKYFWYFGFFSWYWW